jgi:uncharacterized membrane protein YhaH (DUF805 family)
MNFGDAIQSGFRNYVNFRGRASRSEYWYWVLFAVIGGLVTIIADAVIFGADGSPVLNTLFNLALLLPCFAVAVRRLHDTDRTGWWLLIGLSGIGLILLIVWFVLRSDTGANRFGPNPAT